MIEIEKDKIKSILIRIRNNFTTGLLVLAPTAVSAWILLQIFRWFDNILGYWYVRLFQYMNFKNPHIPGLGAVTLFILVTMIGFATRRYAGKKVLAIWEDLIVRIPLINRIYRAVRQISDSFAKGGAVLFTRPVIIEYPRKGLYTMGFVTKDIDGGLCSEEGKKVSCIFIPTTPNPTSGLIIFVPENEIIPVNMSVEDAMKMVISAGVVTPEMRLTN